MLWGAEEQVLKDTAAKRQEGKGCGQPRMGNRARESGRHTEHLVVEVRVREHVEMGGKCCKDTQLKRRTLWEVTSSPTNAETAQAPGTAPGCEIASGSPVSQGTAG